MKTLTTLFALALTSCHPAHADEIDWVNDLSGFPVAQIVRTGQVDWLYDGQGTPIGGVIRVQTSNRIPKTSERQDFPLENVIDTNELSVYNTNMKRRIRPQ